MRPAVGDYVQIVSPCRQGADLARIVKFDFADVILDGRRRRLRWALLALDSTTQWRLVVRAEHLDTHVLPRVRLRRKAAS